MCPIIAWMVEGRSARVHSASARSAGAKGAAAAGAAKTGDGWRDMRSPRSLAGDGDAAGAKGVQAGRGPRTPDELVRGQADRPASDGPACPRWRESSGCEFRRFRNANDNHRSDPDQVQW